MLVLSRTVAGTSPSSSRRSRIRAVAAPTLDFDDSVVLQPALVDGLISLPHVQLEFTKTGSAYVDFNNFRLANL